MPCKARLDELREQIGASDQYTIKIGQRPARFDCFAHPSESMFAAEKNCHRPQAPPHTVAVGDRLVDVGIGHIGHSAFADKVCRIRIGLKPVVNLSIKRAEESEEAPRRRAPQQHAEQQSRPPKQPQQSSGQVAAPTEDQAFEDKLKQFMKDSDSRIADNRMYADRGRSRRRK